ncbi:MAG: DNA topoisomerase VI subunit B [Planctomycetia bacterium]|nr:DNA topoisomerase VI subunit B [Planctomycetia bacterium]
MTNSDSTWIHAFGSANTPSLAAKEPNLHAQGEDAAREEATPQGLDAQRSHDATASQTLLALAEAPIHSANDVSDEQTAQVEPTPNNTSTQTPSAPQADAVSAKPVAKTRKRADAASMAKAQKEISVSEFFAKNRHLLGFDNPRKALLTTVKEAVDNSLDACEEAGILPEVWVKIDRLGENRYRVAVQDAGPGIERKQIPLIYGKLLYGSKFHRLRMSRGQQGIGISAAGMYGLLTTGKPLEVLSKTSVRRPIMYFVVRIDSKTNQPNVLNGDGAGETITSSEPGKEILQERGLEWVDVPSGTRVTIELEAKYQRGRGSVDEYLAQTALANPHATFHYTDPDGNHVDYLASVDQLPPEAIEIQPHPYGVELGKLLEMTRETSKSTLRKFLTESFCRVSPAIANNLCAKAGLSVRDDPRKLQREDVAKLFHAISEVKIPAPSAECVVPIGEQNLLAGLRRIVPGEFFVAATRPPAVYRGYPFQIEVGLAYGGGPTMQQITRESLQEALAESDARTIRQFLCANFEGVGLDGADKVIKNAKIRPRVSPGKLTPHEFNELLKTLQTLNLYEGQTTTVYRYSNRVPLQFQAGACAITQTIMQMNWRLYGLQQTRGQLPRGPLTIIAHFASVWAPYTSESKEALASYPEIQKELRLALQTVGRKLGVFLKRRERVKQESSRRNVFLRYLPEIAESIAEINTGKFSEELTARHVQAAQEDAGPETVQQAIKRSQSYGDIYMKLMVAANRKTALADARYDDSGNRIDDQDAEADELDSDQSVVIVKRD